MGNAFAGLLGGLFVALCVYCYPNHPQAKQVVIWRDSRSATIADVFGLTPDSLDNAENIYADRRK